MNPAARRRFAVALLLWLAGCVLLALYLPSAGEAALRDRVQRALSRQLESGLDEAYFSSADTRVNDPRALQRIGRNMNEAIGGLVAARWYAPWKDCELRLLRIDGVEVAGLNGEPLTLKLSRNGIEREIVYSLTCSRDAWPVVCAGAVLGLLFALILWLLPPPLGAARRRWVDHLTARGYDRGRALALLAPYSASRLSLNAVQSQCLERLHDPDLGNFDAALAVASDPRVAALEPGELGWLELGWRSGSGEVGEILALAAAEDRLVVDLVAMRLTLRGLDMPLGGTPLFYYAWYALQRLEGEGWVTNPPSNRPDPERGAALADLMERHGGHARAIRDLRESGLKARTLDQNRSRIKEDLVAVLGEELARPFLFEAERHPDGVRMRYRLALEARFIRVVA